MMDEKESKAQRRQKIQQRIDLLKKQIPHENDMDFELHLRMVRELEAILKYQK